MYLKLLAGFVLLLSLQACGNGSSGSEPSVASAKYTNWSTVQKVSVGDSTYAATAVDGMVLYTDLYEGLSVVDTANLEQVAVHRKLVDSEVRLDRYGTFDAMYSVSVAGNIASVAVSPGCIGDCMGRSGEIRLYDIGDPSKANYLSTVDTPVMPEALLAEGQYLYVSGSDSNWRNHLAVIDLSDPRQPRQVGAVEIDGAGRLAKAGNRVFVSQVKADGDGSDNYKNIQAVDVSNPATPALAGPPSTVNEGNYRYSPIIVSGDVAYVSDTIHGLYVVDNTNVLSPTLITTIAQPDTVHAMASHANYLYLACGTGGLRVYDIKNPMSPLLVKEIPTSTSIRFVSVTNGRGIYITDGAAGSVAEQELTIFYVDDAR